MIYLYLVAQTDAPSVFLDAPITTGAIFVALTGAITYLYRARDRDRESEHDRLIRTIEQLTEELRQLRNERNTE